MASMPALTMGGLTDGTPANESDVSVPLLQLRDSLNNALAGTLAFGKVNFELAAKTIASDTITITTAYNSVDTEGLAASDNLSTINGGNDGDMIFLYQANSGRVVTVVTGTGNIFLPSGNMTLATNSPLVLFRIGSTWCGQKVPTPLVDHDLFQARLTLTTGVPVTSTDVASSATVYLTPYKGNRIPLYVSGKWENYFLTSDLSLSVAAFTTNTNYDIFIYSNAGVATLVGRAWSSDTARPANLITTDGVLMCGEGGLSHYRYVGTIRIYTAGLTVDSAANRGVWNFYHRVPRHIIRADSTAHAYTLGSWRAWNNDATQTFSFVQGVAEAAMGAAVRATWSGTNVTGVGIAFNGEAGPDIFVYDTSSLGLYRSSAGYRQARLGFNYGTIFEAGNTGITLNAYLIQGLWEC